MLRAYGGSASGGKTRRSGRGAGNGASQRQSGSGSTWSTIRKGSDVTLSNGNLTATTASQAGDWFQTDGTKSSGKLYFEIAVTQSTTNWLWLGIVDSAWGYENAPAPPDPTRVLRSGTFNVGGSTGTVPTIGSGDVLGFAIDLDGKSMSVYENGALACSHTWTGTPSFRIGGYNGFGLAENIVVLRTTAAEFQYPIPNGYTAWGA